MARSSRARAVLSLLSLTALAVGAGSVVIPATTASAATALTVTPNTNLTNGETVSIHGSGFAPDRLVGFCQAVPIAPASVNDCVGSQPDQLFTDDSGSFDATLKVARIVGVAAESGLVDCADPATPCIVAAADGLDLSGTVATAPLAFATPPPPTVHVGTRSVAEGDVGPNAEGVPISLTDPDLRTVTVPWSTVFVPGAPGDQADPGTDYTPASGTVTLSDNTTLAFAQISITGDTVVEPDEYIEVQLGTPTNAVLGTDSVGRLVILNDDVPRVLPGGGAVAEGNSGTTDLHVAVSLSEAALQPVTVQWNTIFITGASDIQADPGTDYTATGGTVTFAPGQTSQSVTISVNGDTQVEPDQWIVVSFHNPTNAKLGGFLGLGFVAIVNDDGT